MTAPQDVDIDFMLTVVDVGKKLKDLNEARSALLAELNSGFYQSRFANMEDWAKANRLIKSSFDKAVGMTLFSLEVQIRRFVPPADAPAPAEPKTDGPRIVPSPRGGDRKTGSLFGVSKTEINKALGFTPNVKDDESKVTASWGFTFDGQHCGIWDYKGSGRDGEYSTFGPHAVFTKLFGARYKAG